MRRNYYGEEYAAMPLKNLQNENLKTLDDLFWVLCKAWSKNTAYPACQAEWIPADPSYGQCAITAMLVHDLIGGTIHRIRVSGGGTHYFNKIDGHYIDLTCGQFDLYHIPVRYEPNEEMPREYCGKNQNTAMRFNLLLERIARVLGEPLKF